MRLVLALVLASLTSLAYADSVTISAPTNNTTSNSPVHLVAAANSSNAIRTIFVYSDNVAVYNLSNQTQIDTYLFLSNGTHKVVVKATTDTSSFSSTVTVNVSGGANTMSRIEDMQGWLWCTKTIYGYPCAGGEGDAVSWMAPYQTSPSLDGSSAEFYVGGSTGYSNALWWKSLGGGNTPKRFTYNFYVYVQHPELPQSLEFDANQSFGGRRWVFGTQCNFKGSGKWDLWDGTSGTWKPSAIPCKPFTANHWTHIVWQFERYGSQVHYISLTVDGQTYNVNTYWGSESYPNSDINIAFQMDGDYQQDPYNVWLDKVTFKAW